MTETRPHDVSPQAPGAADTASATPGAGDLGGEAPAAPHRRDLSPAAQRALAEAAARRAAGTVFDPAARPPEIDGRRGPEPVRYGDWERNGIVSDF